MNKVEMIAELVEVVNTAVEAKKAVYDFLATIEDTEQAGKEAVAEMQATLQAKEEALTTYTSFEDIKVAQKEITDLKNDIELVEQVNANKIVSMLVQLEDVAEEALKAYKTAVTLYRNVDKVLVANTTLTELPEALKVMQDLTLQLEGVLRGVRQILLDTGIVAQADQNRSFRGYHLGQRGANTVLHDYELKVRQFMYELKHSGVVFQ